MASLTKKKKKKHKRQMTMSGKARKRNLAVGTTPRFPVNLEDDPGCVVPQPPGSHPEEQ